MRWLQEFSSGSKNWPGSKNSFDANVIRYSDNYAAAAKSAAGVQVKANAETVVNERRDDGYDRQVAMP
jgi:hypothetical protein